MCWVTLPVKRYLFKEKGKHFDVRRLPVLFLAHSKFARHTTPFKMEIFSDEILFLSLDIKFVYKAEVAMKRFLKKWAH